MTFVFTFLIRSQIVLELVRSSLSFSFHYEVSDSTEIRRLLQEATKVPFPFLLLRLSFAFSDLCEATLTGAWISISAAILIALLFGLVKSRTLRTTSGVLFRNWEIT